MSLYLEHFGLRELPFRLTAAVDYFFRGTGRGSILDAIRYALSNGEGILAVFGEVGSGKSMMCRRLMVDLADECDLVYVANPSLSGREILYHIAEELGIDVGGERHQIASRLQQHLIDLHASGRRVVVCIDEAQAMPDESLEQIRLLSNLETSREKIVQIVMFGQPELHAKLKQQHMRQLRERITSSFTLQNFAHEEVRAYIDARLRCAGYDQAEQLFMPSAVVVITRISQGILRRVNILCDKSLLAAFADGDKRISARHAEQAARDARYQRMVEHNDSAAPADAAAPPALGRRPDSATMIAAALVVLACIVTIVQFWPRPAPSAPVAAAAISAPPAAPSATPSAAAVANLPAAAPVAAVSASSQSKDRQQLPRVELINNPNWNNYPIGSYLRQQLNVTETMLDLLDDANLYTARIMTAPRNHAIDIERYLRDLARHYAVHKIMVYPSHSEGQDNFVVTYGQFASEFEAEFFIQELPSFFRSGRPFVQALSVSQLESASHW
ncbi:MAG: AAA family ATPase [Betaproteobacteria bacterium]|nr:AAA family ATPase [Betaproteobacteria bacterium]